MTDFHYSSLHWWVTTHLNVVADVFEDLFLCDSEVRVVIFGMRAYMDDAIHVQIQVVKFWQLVKHNIHILL